MAVQSFLHTGHLVKEVNYTHVCLIPKVEHLQDMSQLCPIALCNVIYKICAKVIANRLKKFLPQIISPYQSAFVPGRLITIILKWLMNGCTSYIINGPTMMFTWLLSWI